MWQEHTGHQHKVTDPRLSHTAVYMGHAWSCSEVRGRSSSYLQNPVKGSKTSTVRRPVGSDHVHVNSFFQESV